MSDLPIVKFKSELLAAALAGDVAAVRAVLARPEHRTYHIDMEEAGMSVLLDGCVLSDPCLEPPATPVRVMLEAGADPNLYASTRGWGGKSVFQVACEFAPAAAHAMLDCRGDPTFAGRHAVDPSLRGQFSRIDSAPGEDTMRSAATGGDVRLVRRLVEECGIRMPPSTLASMHCDNDDVAGYLAGLICDSWESKDAGQTVVKAVKCFTQRVFSNPFKR